MASTSASKAVSPVWVALCAWLVPGGGYYVLGQRGRAASICVSVIALFLLGILIGGIRVADPPGWGAYGYMTQIVLTPLGNGELEEKRVEPSSPQEEANPAQDRNDQVQGPALFTGFTGELSDKPWFVGQVLCGPISLIAATISVHEARPIATATPADSSAVDSMGNPLTAPQQHVPMSHARSWEIGTLYTAVAGMLNLLAIIDSTFHVNKEEEAAT
jgi:hypothetical protein